MVRLTYYFFYALSLLPLWVLYGMADFFAWLLFRVIGYRRQIIKDNLKNSFPQKTEAELRHIRLQFYRCFMQNWVETIKLLSISTTSINKRITTNWDVVHQLHEKHPRVQILLGHCFNWEWACANTSLKQPYLTLPVYLHLSNQAMDKLFITIRSRFGAKPVRAGEMAKEMLPYRNSKYMIALLADQSPPKPAKAYWVNFMNQPTPFINGPERNSRAAGMPIVYFSIRRIRRGYYECVAELFSEDPAGTKEGELTRRYAHRLQQDIEASPHTYLWSHRRWKHKWNSTYEKLWMDEAPKPEEK